MSKLSDKFAAGKKALAEREALAAKDGQTPQPSPFARAAGPLHGSVSTMKIDLLKGEVEKLKAAKPVLKLLPEEIRASRWSNRHKDSFKSAEFKKLKDEIRSAGGNVQPIKVRSLFPTDGEFKYEIVFGHRRHQACLELGMNVLAIVEDLDERNLFIEMDRENRQRANLRPYEQGVMYKRALAEGLFPSLRKMAEELGVDPSNVTKAIKITELPAPVLSVFSTNGASVLDIQYGWSRELHKLNDSDPELLLTRVKDMAGRQEINPTMKFSSSLIYDVLIGKKPLSKDVLRNALNAFTTVGGTVKVGSKSYELFHNPEMTSVKLGGLEPVQIEKLQIFLKGLLTET